MFTRAFWSAALERALKTAAQSAVLVIGADQFDALTVSWPEVGGFALGGFVLSLLTSVGSDAVSDRPGPSLTDAEQLG